MATANMAAVAVADLKAKAGCVWNTAITVSVPVQSATMTIKKAKPDPALFTLTVGHGLTIVNSNKIAITGPCLALTDYYFYEMEVITVSGITFYITGRIYFF